MRTESLRTAAALVLAMAVGARAATITVDATGDSLATDGNCTLREAILAANGDTAVDTCAAGSGSDVVVVPAGTYHLGGAANEDAGLTGDLDITDNLDLVGAGAATTIILTPADSSGCTCTGWCEPCFPQLDRVLDVDPAGGGIPVHVSGVTLSNTLGLPGVAEGGEIRNRGTLAVIDSVIAGGTAPVLGTYNRGGGIFSQGPLHIERSVIRDNAVDSNGSPSGSSGGGISALGPLEVIDSTIDGNK